MINRFGSISSKLLLSMLFVALFASVLSGVLYFRKTQNDAGAMILEDLKFIGLRQSFEIHNFIKNEEEKISLITSRTQLRRSLDEYNKEIDKSSDSANEHLRKIKKILQDAAKSVPDIKDIFILDENKKYILSASGGSINGELDFLKNYNSRIFLSTDRIIFLEELLLNDESIGYIAVKASITELKNIIHMSDGYNVKNIFIVYQDDNGNLETLISMRKGQLPNINPFSISKSKHLTLITDNDNDYDRFLIVNVISPYNFGFIIESDVKSILSILSENEKYLLTVLLISFFVTIICAYQLSKFIINPIKHMAEVADLIAAGDYRKRIEYMSKDELGRLANSINKMTNELMNINEVLEDKINEKTRELREANDKLMAANKCLEELSIHDSLTNLYNRRHFDKAIATEWERCKRQKDNILLLIVDIDCFKQFNDSLGHLAGDRCIKIVASILQGCAGRRGDVVARYGGEEFVILAPCCEEEKKYFLANSILEKIREEKISHPDSKVSEHVTVSIGYGIITPNRNTNLENFVHSVDKALYKAKEEGRNRAIEASFK